MGPDLVPITADWSDGVGVMVTTHFGLVLGLFLAPRDPKRARFGPQCHFWGSWMDSEGPGGQIWSQLPLIGLPGLESLYTTHFCLVFGLFLAPQGLYKGSIWPESPFWSSWRDSEGPREPYLVPTATDCCASVEIMVGGLFLVARGPKSARFSSKCPFFGPCEVQYGAK